MNKYKELRKLSYIVDNQPNTKKGLCNTFVCYKFIVKFENDILNDFRSKQKDVKFELQELKQIIENSDIVNKDVERKFYDLSEISREFLRAIEEAKEIKYNLANLFVDLLEDMEKAGVTNHEFAQLVGCPVENINQAETKYQDWDLDDIGFFEYCISEYNVERRKRNSDWKQGILFEFLTDRLMWAINNIDEVKKKSEEFLEKEMMKEDIDMFTKNKNGELEKYYPEPKLIEGDD